MRFGRSLTVSVNNDGQLVATELKYSDWSTVHKITRLTESIKLQDNKDVLAEFLILLDRHKSGEITDFGMECFTDQNGTIVRAEKTWIVPDLH